MPDIITCYFFNMPAIVVWIIGFNFGLGCVMAVIVWDIGYV